MASKEHLKCRHYINFSKGNYEKCNKDCPIYIDIRDHCEERYESILELFKKGKEYGK